MRSFPLFLIGILALCAVLIACDAAGPTCAKPYMRFANTCCLDKAGNGVCDKDEGLMGSNNSQQAYRYVCPDGSVADSPEKCAAMATGAIVAQPAASPEPLQPVPVAVPSLPSRPTSGDAEPQTTPEPSEQESAQPAISASAFDPYPEQDATYINRFDVTPVCRGAFRAAELHFDLSKVPDGISVEVLEDPDGRFRDIGSMMGTGETYFYIGFCKDCSHLTDAQLDSKPYLVRGVLTYGDRDVYTREYVVDPKSAEYAKKCY